MRLAFLFVLFLATATFGEFIKPRHWGVGNGITADETPDAETTDTENVQERSLTDLHIEPTDTGTDLLPFPQPKGPCVQKRCTPIPDGPEPEGPVPPINPHPCRLKRCTPVPPDTLIKPEKKPIKFPGGQPCRRGLRKRCTPVDFDVHDFRLDRIALEDVALDNRVLEG